MGCRSSFLRGKPLSVLSSKEDKACSPVAYGVLNPEAPLRGFPLSTPF